MSGSSTAAVTGTPQGPASDDYAWPQMQEENGTEKDDVQVEDAEESDQTDVDVDIAGAAGAVDDAGMVRMQRTSPAQIVRSRVTMQCQSVGM